MDAVITIALIDGLIGLALRVAEQFQPTGDTSEEQARILESLKTKLADTAAQVAAWRPKDVQP